MNQSDTAERFTVNALKMFLFSSEDFASIRERAELGFIDRVEVHHALQMQLLP
jgi:hypothetical protein